MTRHLLIDTAIAALLACAGTAAAQQMYRCGSTYSQTPCGPDAAPKTLSSGAAPDTPAGPTGFELCAVAARKAYGGPEPETARIERLGERRSEVLPYAGQPIATHRYDLGIDARTQHGVFSGVRPHVCWLSEDQRRVLKLAPAGG